jgi:hypothetical protein
MIYILTRKFVHHMCMYYDVMYFYFLHLFLLHVVVSSYPGIIHHRNIGSRNTLLLKLNEEEDPGEFFLLFF